MTTKLLDEDYREPYRCFLDQDHSSHWYVVEAEYRDEWEEWLALDEDDEESWEAPSFASRLEVHHSRVEFEENWSIWPGGGR